MLDAEAVVAATGALVVLLDEAYAVAAVNPAAAALLGRSAEALVGADAAPLLVRPRDVAALRQALRRKARTAETITHETTLDAPDGRQRSLLWSLSTVAPDRLALVGLDVSATRSELDVLQTQAHTDLLTGLANRAALLTHLRSLSGTGATVVFGDLNGFKAVNDTHGHAAGDAVLVEVARRFVRAVRGEDLVARLGGDEFVVVAPGPASDAETLQARLVRALRQPMLLGDGVVAVVGVALGVSELAPGEDPEAALARADAAMYSTKPADRGPLAAPVVALPAARDPQAAPVLVP